MGNKQSAEKQIHYIMIRTDSYCKKKVQLKRMSGVAALDEVVREGLRGGDL